MKKIFVSDTTLKVIEELENNYSFREKLSISAYLDELNLDAIELPELVNSKEREMVYMAVHGLLHLLGYDHLIEEEKKIMRETEEKIMKKINLERN